MHITSPTRSSIQMEVSFVINLQEGRGDGTGTVRCFALTLSEAVGPCRGASRIFGGRMERCLNAVTIAMVRTASLGACGAVYSKIAISRKIAGHLL